MSTGQPQYGGIASPGNAPWVLTVGASSDLGTADRRDDVVAAFSSRGPAAIDENAKPDLVAPGVNIESTADPSSALFAANPASRLWGTAKTGSEPYLSLTGTSMAAPVVTGAIALMLEANAALTPNAVKAILEYTAEARAGYNHLTQGAGFLNARGAVELARAFAGAALVPGALERPGALEPAHHLGQPPRRGRHARRPRQRVEAGRDLGRRADAGRRGDRLGRRVPRRPDRLQPGALDRPCNVVTPDCDPARRSTVACDRRSTSPARRQRRSIAGIDDDRRGHAARPKDALDQPASGPPVAAGARA